MSNPEPVSILGNILVVDDTPANLNLLVGMLKNKGYLVRPAPSGRLALLAAEMEPPDLILLDVNMPGMDGYEVCRRLKQNEKLRQIPVIFISALSETLDKVKAFSVGGVDYVTKPFQFEEVEARLSTHLKLSKYQAQIENWNEQLTLKVNEQTRYLQVEMAKRINVQNLLEEEKEVLATTLLSIQNGIVATDPDGIITMFNRAAEGITHYSFDQVHGKRITQVFRLLDGKAEMAEDLAFEHLIGLPQSVHNPSDTLVTADSEHKLISHSTGKVIDKSGRLLGYVIVFDDITDQTMREAQYALSQKMESIGQLAAGIAHEINTPMQFVGDNTQFLKDSFDDLKPLIGACRTCYANNRKYLPDGAEVNDIEKAIASLDVDYLMSEIPTAIGQSLEGIERVRKIVLAMKAFSHPGGDGMQLADINRNLETTATISRNEWKYVSDLELDLDPDLPLVPCLIDEINQVLLNMIINAAQAIEELLGKSPTDKGKITIHTRTHPTYISIEIQDTGAGIPPNIINRIFDPFFTTKRVGKGTGQGLSLAHNVIVNKHQGQILVHSEPGQGTTFEIHLPIEGLNMEGKNMEEVSDQ